MDTRSMQSDVIDFLDRVSVHLDVLEADAALLERSGDQKGAAKVRYYIARLRRKYETAQDAVQNRTGRFMR